ncbi:MAG: DUF4054 domain-containing protein [Pseudomonadota bacterium]
MTPADFKALLPAFKDVPNPVVQVMIDASDEAFEPCRWGASLEFYRAQWVAHMLVVSRADGAPTLAVEANDVVTRVTETLTTTRSDALMQLQAVEDFMRTTWGQRYINRARQVGMGGATA